MRQAILVVVEVLPMFRLRKTEAAKIKTALELQEITKCGFHRKTSFH